MFVCIIGRFLWRSSHADISCISILTSIEQKPPTDKLKITPPSVDTVFLLGRNN